MKIKYHKHFLKDVAKLGLTQKQKLAYRLKLFETSPNDRELGNHELKGKLKGHFSIDITGDIRAIYRFNDDCIEFIRLGTHSQLY